MKTKIADLKEEVRELREETIPAMRQAAKEAEEAARAEAEADKISDDSDVAAGRKSTGGSSRAIYLVGFLLVLVNLGCYAAFDVHTYVKTKGWKEVGGATATATVSDGKVGKTEVEKTEVHHFHTNQKEYITEVKEVNNCPSVADILKQCPAAPAVEVTCPECQQCPPKVDKLEVAKQAKADVEAKFKPRLEEAMENADKFKEQSELKT